MATYLRPTRHLRILPQELLTYAEKPIKLLCLYVYLKSNLPYCSRQALLPRGHDHVGQLVVSDAVGYLQRVKVQNQLLLIV